MKSRKWLLTLTNKITNVRIPLLGLFPLQADAWPHRQPCTMWKGRLIYWQRPLGPQQRELHISQEDWRHIDTVVSRFNDVFRNKKMKELMGRRGSTPEQVHREQKGKKDTQNFLGHQVQPAASVLHPSRHHFTHSSPTFHLTISLQRWAPQLPTWQPPCLLSLWSTPAISSQATLVLPARLPPMPGLPQR